MAAPAGSPLGTAPLTPGASAKTPSGAAAGRPAAFLAEPGSGVSSYSGGALREERPKAGGGDEGDGDGGGDGGGPEPMPMPRPPPRPGPSRDQGEDESGILQVRLPSPTKLAAKHFRQSPVANSQNSTFGPYDA